MIYVSPLDVNRHEVDLERKVKELIEKICPVEDVSVRKSRLKDEAYAFVRLIES